MKQLLIAQGKYEEFLALPPSENPNVRAFEDKIRALKRRWDNSGETYLPWPDLGGSSFFLDENFSIGDMWGFGTRRHVPVRVYLYYDRARDTNNPLYSAFTAKKRKNVDAYIKRVSDRLQRRSGGRFSLQLESIQFRPPAPALSDRPQTSLFDLAASPEIKSTVGLGLTMFIGDFLPSQTETSAFSHYGGGGLINVASTIQTKVDGQDHEAFFLMPAMEWMAAHEIAHSLGMLHRTGPRIDPVLTDLREDGYLFGKIIFDEEAGYPSLDMSNDLQSGDQVLRKLYGLSLMNLLRMGWLPDSPPRARAGDVQKLAIPRRLESAV
jgi:hypothetical protein